MLGRRVLLAALVPYVVWLIFGYRYHLIDGVNLGVHETGHFVFGFFGQTLHFLGGSIGQLMFPIAFVVYFARRRQIFEAAVLTVWVAESMMYMAEYLGDAQAQILPLVGGHIHDWNWLLTRAGLLAHCEIMADAIHVLASLLAVGAVALATMKVWRGQTIPDEFDDLEPCP